MTTLITVLVWVAAGAEGKDAYRRESQAIFQPVALPLVPAVRGIAQTDVDRFILARLEAIGLGFNSQADRLTLLRRVSLDLTGLPPSLEEIDLFVGDSDSNAYARMVDRYLASPHYGERWGKYWLDAAGYADSNGYFNSDSDRPLAWRYRDYVIRAFNRDIPYDRFIQEQLAGDEMVGYVPDGDVTTSMIDPITATHFLRNAPDGTGESDGNPDEVRTDRFTVLEGNVQNLMNCLMGLTVQCARCHDHKFEPITQEEYYSLQAILFPVYNPDRWSKPNDRTVSLGTRAQRASIDRANQRIDQQIKRLQSGMSTIHDLLTCRLLEERFASQSKDTRNSLITAALTPADKQSDEQKKLLMQYPAASVSMEEFLRHYPAMKAMRANLDNAINRLEESRPAAMEKVAAYVETDKQPAVHHLLKRGQHGRPDREVQPGVPMILNTSDNRYQVKKLAETRISTGRRTALARWITSPQHPLLARVLVNRIWAHHFGTGIVATVDNLGVSGAMPSHPELLDYLAVRFIANGWSIKEVHRLILNSSVYRQKSTTTPESARLDPANRMLSRFPLRRLDAEAVRDAMLAVSGELDMRSGGPFVPSRRTADGVVEVAEKTPGALRRSVYLQQRRTQVITFLQLFDAPAMVTTCGQRSPSTVPLQSLALLNSEFARQRALSFAERLNRAKGTDVDARLQMAFRLALGKLPDEVEKEASKSFLEKQRVNYPLDPDSHVWVDLCQMLLASNAFLYVE